jgi:hypothetical protein
MHDGFIVMSRVRYNYAASLNSGFTFVRLSLLACAMS